MKKIAFVLVALMVSVAANAQFEQGKKYISTSLSGLTLGVGGRYYIVQNGIYLGAGVNYKHSECYNDFLPTVQVGYAFFVNGCITIEPEIYYEQSFKNHKDFSKVGLRLGLGFYF